MPDDPLRDGPTDDGDDGFQQEPFRPCHCDRADGSNRHRPVPEVRTALTEFAEDDAVSFFEIPDECIALCCIEKEVEEKFSVSRRAVFRSPSSYKPIEVIRNRTNENRADNRYRKYVLPFTEMKRFEDQNNSGNDERLCWDREHQVSLELWWQRHTTPPISRSPSTTLAATRTELLSTLSPAPVISK